MNNDECHFFLTHVLKASEADARIMIEECLSQGWTQPYPVGPMHITLARLPNNQGIRSSNFQVTVR